ncbi:hypothetical protein OPT61_g7964 [Boeremia exigua]|uniref:Uncharacterized protein n=1 Tax=Boeremia exigua TaxID=749465 RepID=A0ACC2I088_9PLEO|nr:hypothetical protein OPT61_g7964 [Boeremia exigua]
MSLYQAPDDNPTARTPVSQTHFPEGSAHLHANATQSYTSSRGRELISQKKNDSGPCSIVLGEPDRSQRSSVWQQAWITPASIVGFYTIALLCAIAHFCVFNYLDGRVAYQGSEPVPFPSTSIPQSYVTTVSLVLVTAFRAALVASIGVCYTQYLWCILRRRTLEVEVIEELFQIRANVLRLLNWALVRCTPSLVLVATLSWIIPIATIYPPGALTVGIEMRTVEQQFMASVIPESGKLMSDVTKLNGSNTPPSFGTLIDNYYPCNASNNCIILKGPSSAIQKITDSVLFNNRMAELSSPSSSNASYVIQFPGPMLLCQQSNEIEISWHHIISHGTLRDFNAMTWSPILHSYIDPHWHSGYIRLEDPVDEDPIFLAPCGINAPPTEDVYLRRRYITTDCRAATAEYTVNINFTNGRHDIQYFTGEVHPLEDILPITGFKPDLDFTPLKSWEEYFNIMALVESLLSRLEATGFKETDVFYSLNETMPENTVSVQSQNGSMVDACQIHVIKEKHVEWRHHLAGSSAFNERPFFNINEFSMRFFNFSEALLNEVLANITISALSLNLWYESVNGTETRVFNVYTFQRQLNFFLPYGLCLLFTLPIIAIGLVSLQQNGASAIDGGFLQILMTAATGQTQIEKVAARGCSGGYENVPDELRNLKVRFGELVAHDEPVEGTKAGSEDTRRVAYGAGFNQSGEDIALIPMSQERGSGSDQNQADSLAEVASGAEKHKLTRRAGFGTESETIPLQRGSLFSRP